MAATAERRNEQTESEPRPGDIVVLRRRGGKDPLGFFRGVMWKLPDGQPYYMLEVFDERVIFVPVADVTEVEVYARKTEG